MAMVVDAKPLWRTRASMTATPSFLDLRSGPLRPTAMFAAAVAAGIGVGMLAIAGIWP